MQIRNDTKKNRVSETISWKEAFYSSRRKAYSFDIKHKSQPAKLREDNNPFHCIHCAIHWVSAKPWTSVNCSSTFY